MTTVFGHVTPYSLVENPRRFGGMCCFNIRGILLWTWRQFVSSKLWQVSVLLHSFVLQILRKLWIVFCPVL